MSRWITYLSHNPGGKLWFVHYSFSFMADIPVSRLAFVCVGVHRLRIGIRLCSELHECYTNYIAWMKVNDDRN